MTVDKEAIRRMDRAMNAIHLELPESVATDIHDTWNDAKAAMDEYAASLRKENEELREIKDNVVIQRNEYMNAFDDLQLKYGQLQLSNEAKEKEIERLKGLLEFHIKSMYDGVEDIDTFWQQFKTKNNL